MLYFHDTCTIMDTRALHVRHLRLTSPAFVCAADLNPAQPSALRPHVLRLLQLLPLVFPRLAALDVEFETFPDCCVTAAVGGAEEPRGRQSFC